jgi:hypothetical protein
MKALDTMRPPRGGLSSFDFAAAMFVFFAACHSGMDCA